MINILIIVGQILSICISYEYSKGLVGFEKVIDINLTLISLLLIGIFWKLSDIVNILKNNKKGDK